MKKLKTIYTILLFFTLSLLNAKSVGIVVGANGGNLIGAINDAKDMARVLEARGVKVEYKLYGEDATKSSIVKSFQQIAKSAKRGDWLYFFFSGHGTSPYDPNLKDKNLKQRLQDSGALIGSDNKYIIVKEDLAPLFRELDKKGVNVILIVDACFAGSSYKGAFESNSNNRFIFYSNELTKKDKFPYKHLRFFSSTTYSDFASESSKYKRGYFSKAISECIAKYSQSSKIKKCLDYIKYTKQELPQVPIILPEYDFTIFDTAYTKGVKVVPKKKDIKDKLLDLAYNSNKLTLFTTTKDGKISKNFTPKDELILHIKTNYSGNLALFTKEASGNLRLILPNASMASPFIEKTHNQKLIAIKATPPYGLEEWVAFLVDLKSAKELQKLYKKSNGLLNKEDTKKAIEIIQQNKIIGGGVSIFSSNEL